MDGTLNSTLAAKGETCQDKLFTSQKPTTGTDHIRALPPEEAGLLSQMVCLATMLSFVL